VKERKIEITTETYEVLVINRRDRLSRRWCASCGRPVAVISLNDAIESGLDVETARLQIKNGQLHMLDGASGSPSVCLYSLLQQLKGDLQ
jgi:hypothetical protein